MKTWLLDHGWIHNSPQYGTCFKHQTHNLACIIISVYLCLLPFQYNFYRINMHISNSERIQIVYQLQASRWITDVMRSFNISKIIVMKTTKIDTAKKCFRPGMKQYHSEAFKIYSIRWGKGYKHFINVRGCSTHCWFFVTFIFDPMVFLSCVLLMPKQFFK